jgi:hypothetical protein
LQLILPGDLNRVADVVFSDGKRDGEHLTNFTVVLEVGGSPCGSTSDVVEADTDEQAEAYAISAWRLVRPDRRPRRRSSPRRRQPFRL